MTQICELMALSINNIINNNDKLNILKPKYINMKILQLWWYKKKTNPINENNLKTFDYKRSCVQIIKDGMANTQTSETWTIVSTKFI
jgi:hypothetical protein